jgi:serine protease inhibitor
MRHSLLGCAAALALGACGSSTGPDGPPPLLSALPRPLSQAELRIAEGVNGFALALLREATREAPAESNTFLSPLSAAMALAMALNGAGGETFDAMRGPLGLGELGEAEIDAGYRDLIALLRGLDGRVEMLVANSMWARNDLSLEPAFVAAGRDFFDAEIRTLDFGTPGAVEAINDWVAGKTNGRIPRLLDAIAREEVLFLVNAVYFKGRWREMFDSDHTAPGPFYGADGRERSALLMRQEATLRYGETERYQAVDLLYGNGAFAMTLVLPRPGGTPAELLASLDPASWRDLVARLGEATVHLTLPRFRLDYARSLGLDLAAIGMGIAFDPDRADFSRIADVRPERLFLTRVEQKTFVEVNEEGTEAAAATAVGVGVTSAPLTYEMRVDRPFLFAIRERFSGTLIFIGVMNAIGE